MNLFLVNTTTFVRHNFKVLNHLPHSPLAMPAHLWSLLSRQAVLHADRLCLADASMHRGCNYLGKKVPYVCIVRYVHCVDHLTNPTRDRGRYNSASPAEAIGCQPLPELPGLHGVKKNNHRRTGGPREPPQSILAPSTDL